MPRIGAFEFLVLLSILGQEDGAYANPVRQDLEANARLLGATGADVMRGFVGRT